MRGLLDLGNTTGLAPFGLRYEESVFARPSAKGKGYYGLLSHASGGQSTEISAHDERGVGFPLLVPGLTREEMNLLLSGQEPTQDLYLKARQFAQQRMSAGASPFAPALGLKFPLPE
jgi:hypothetical protein